VAAAKFCPTAEVVRLVGSFTLDFDVLAKAPGVLLRRACT
jgi:hypothetical protein